MEDYLMDLLQPKINERVNNEINNDRRTNLYLYVQRGGMSVDFAAHEAGMSTADFSAAMTNAGYKLPQMANR